MKEFDIGAVVGVLGGFISLAVGGFDTIFKAMFALMVIDVICGCVAAAFFNKSKYSKNGLSSDAMIKGTVRKMGMLVIVCVGTIVDAVIGIDYARNCVVMYFIATEGISIMEHMQTMGIPLPKFVLALLETIKDQSDGGNDLGT